MMSVGLKARREGARVARDKVEELRARRAALLEAGGDRFDYAELLEEEFRGGLKSLDYTAAEIEATLEEIQAGAKPVAVLEGLVATLRAFRELGALDELRAVLEDEGAAETAGG